MFWLAISLLFGLISYFIYKRQSKSTNFAGNAPKQYDHAIIMGGSFAGMVTAAYLLKFFKRITIIESDDVLNDIFMKSTPTEILDYRCRLQSPTSLGRSGVGQIYQLHVLQNEGFKILTELFPQLKDKLFNEYGACNCSHKNESRLMFGGALLNTDLTEDFEVLGIDRFTLEIILRKEFCRQFSNQIEWKCNTRVTEFIADQASNVVKGIKYRLKHSIGSPSIDMYGDFIIDCTGRNTSSLKWLQRSLNLIVPTEQIHFGCGYVSCIGERFRTGDPSLDSAVIFGIGTDSPQKNVGLFVSPIRRIKTTDNNSLGTLVTVIVCSVNSENVPNDSYENLLEWTKESLDPGCYTILKETKICSPILTYHRAFDDRKFVESVGKKWPQNFILLGDSMCTFNPIYAQGMTHACRQARELAKIFNENGHNLIDISHIFNRRASVITSECWFASTANDWKTPTLKVIKTDKYGQVKTYQRGGDSTSTNYPEPRTPLMIRFMQWYGYWLLRCASKSGHLSTDFLRVTNQIASPSILMKPTTILAVCRLALMHGLKLSKN